MIIDGKKMAQDILGRLKVEVSDLKLKGITPTLAVVLIGNDENSEAYIKQKQLKAEEIGASVKVNRFPTTVTSDEIERIVKELNTDPKIHGIILQRPAPEQIKVDEIEEYISEEKEVDGFGAHSIYPIPVAEAVFRMIGEAVGKSGEDLENFLKRQKITLIGKGETAGKPIYDYFQKKGISLNIIESHTENKNSIIKDSDILISAVGKENILTPDAIKDGAILIGVGLHMEGPKLRGDYSDGEIAEKATSYSPTPGGVGPVNVACLMENLVQAAKLVKSS